MINTPVLSPPVASFAAPTACLNAPTIFTDGSSGATGWYWQFGDGGTANVQNPVHTYQGYGSYVVTLIVSAGGATCADTVLDTVQVNALPVVNFTHDTVCQGNSTSFTDLSYIPSGTIAQWNWNFGDASTSSAQNPVHAYAAGGTYTVTLTCTSNNNCASQLTLPVLVYPLPLANFSTAPAPAALLTDSITFTDLSTGGVNNWQWDFGDSTFDTVQFPQHLYTDTGSFIITLIVETPNGCRDTISKTLRIEDYAFYIPTAFTPNGDDRNEFFFGTGIGITDYEMWIFDRWGNAVFYCTASNAPQNAPCKWDGKVKGGESNERVQQDVYVWKVRLNTIFKEEKNYIGTVTVVR
jgi:gliding motility-associated-like protein